MEWEEGDVKEIHDKDEEVGKYFMEKQMTILGGRSIKKRQEAKGKGKEGREKGRKGMGKGNNVEKAELAKMGRKKKGE
jgi:hypothetical protein